MTEARVFYVLIFAVSLWINSMVLEAPSLVARVDAFLHIPSTVFGLMELPRLGPQPLGFIRILTAIAAACAMLGLLGWLSRLLLALGATTLYLAACGALGHAHSFHLPTLILFLLCFAPSGGRSTLDYWVARKLPSYPFRALPPAPGSVANSGFVRRMILLTAVGLLFSGGVTKLLDAGWRWADGEPLRFYIAIEQVTLRPARWPFLADYLVQNAWFARTAATAALLFELASITALFSSACRNIVAILAVLFHLGIKAVMYPDYTPSIVSYLFLIDWRSGIDYVRARAGKPAVRGTPEAASESATPAARAALLCVYSYAAVWLVSPFFKIDTWPVTHVPMFSTYVSSREVDRWPLAAFDDPAQLPAIARELSTRLSYGALFYIRGRTRVRAAGGPGGKTQDVTAQLEKRKRSAWLFQSVSAVLDAVMEDPGGRARERSARFVAECARSLRRQHPGLLTGYRSLELTYLLRGADTVVMSIPLDPVP